MTEEHYEVLDEEGNKTGEVLPKSIVHDKELCHGAAFVWIYNSKGEVLLQFRAADKKAFPNVWDVSTGGHISAGHTPLQTAVEETVEEVGLAIAPDELEFVTRAYDVVPWLPNKKHPEFDWVYLFKCDQEIARYRAQKEELTDIKMMSVDELLAALDNPESRKHYAARQPEVFKDVLLLIKDRLQHD